MIIKLQRKLCDHSMEFSRNISIFHDRDIFIASLIELSKVTLLPVNLLDSEWYVGEYGIVDVELFL